MAPQYLTQYQDIPEASLDTLLADPEEELDFQENIEPENENDRGYEHKTLTLFCKKCGFQWVATLTCGDRTCPICRKKWFGHHRHVLERLLKAWGNDLRVMGLTVKNIPDDQFNRDSVKYMRKCFSRLIHRKYYKERIQGGFYVIHLTNIGNGWHLHLHVIYKGRYIEHKRLKEDWHQITRNSYIVYLKPLNGVRRAIDYLLGDLLQKPRIREEDRSRYNAVLKRLRLVQGFGEYSRTSFKEPFVCPMCGNTTWLCREYEWLDKDEVIEDTS